MKAPGENYIQHKTFNKALQKLKLIYCYGPKSPSLGKYGITSIGSVPIPWCIPGGTFQTPLRGYSTHPGKDVYHHICTYVAFGPHLLKASKIILIKPSIFCTYLHY